MNSAMKGERRKFTSSLTFQMRETYLALVFLLVLFTLGTIGYMTIEGWSASDSAFMTLITLSTVGYEEVHPLSPYGRIFTAVLIVAGVGLVAFALATISRDIIHGEFFRLRIFRKMQSRIASLSHHTIICGYGRLARLVTKELSDAGHEVVIVENDPEVARELIAEGRLFIEGTAHEDETLKAAGVERASTLLALISSEADNVYISLVARDLNPKIHIVARSESESAENKLRRAGANQVLTPYRVSAARIVNQLLRPNVSNFIEVATTSQGEQLLLEEVVVPQTSALVGETLETSQLRAKTGAMVAATISPDGSLTLSPDGHTRLLSGHTLIVLGDRGSIDGVTNLLVGS